MEKDKVSSGDMKSELNCTDPKHTTFVIVIQIIFVELMSYKKKHQCITMIKNLKDLFYVKKKDIHSVSLKLRNNDIIQDIEETQIAFVWSLYFRHK